MFAHHNVFECEVGKQLAENDILGREREKDSGAGYVVSQTTVVM
jgi:hypothetical protein